MLAAINHTTASLLTFSGWGLIVFLGLLIVVPYWRGKSDLATAWNFVLLGCMIFMGVACLDAADPPKYFFAQYISFDFPDKDYRATLIRTFFFLGCLLVFHYVLPVGRKFSSKRFLHSPPWSPTLYGLVLLFCIGTVIADFVLRQTNVTFLREAFMNLGHKAALFGVSFAFYAWYRNRLSPGPLLIFLVIFVLSALYVMQVSHGRRLLLSLVFAPIAVMYWTTWRYRAPAKVLTLCTLSLAFIVGVGLWYQTFRFFDKKGNAGERSIARVALAARQVDFKSMAEQLSTWKNRLPQSCYAYSLVIKRLVDTDQLEPRLFNSLQFLLTYPIPRRMWPEKPEPIGAIIVTDVLKIPQPTNWGLGVAGQGYYEGDWIALFVYAILVSIMVRMFDEPLKREPNNPFFIAACASASFYIITLLRGDMGNQASEVIENFLFLWLAQRCGALVVGSKIGAYMWEFGSVFASRNAKLYAR